MGKRKKVEEIIDSLFEALPVKNTLPITTIAVQADVSFKTATRYIELIRDIQSRPKVHREKIGEQIGYRRQTQAGRPPNK